MKAKLFLFACLMSAGAFGQDAPVGPKVYLEIDDSAKLKVRYSTFLITADRQKGARLNRLRKTVG